MRNRDAALVCTVGGAPAGAAATSAVATVVTALVLAELFAVVAFGTALALVELDVLRVLVEA
jgi:hypothetical protein